MKIDSEDKQFNRQLRLQERKFVLLVRDIEYKRLKIGTSLEKIKARYGEPILELPVEGKAQLVKLLYRHPLKYFNASKVYLYFDSSQTLLKWDFLKRQ